MDEPDWKELYEKEKVRADGFEEQLNRVQLILIDQQKHLAVIKECLDTMTALTNS